MPKQWSLRTRLLLLLTGVILAVSLVQVWISYRAVLLEADEMFDYQMKQMAVALGSSDGTGLVGSVPTNEDVEDFELILGIRDRDGLPVYSNSALALPASAPVGFSTAVVDGEPYRIFTRVGPTTRVQVAQEVESRREIAVEIALHALWPMLLLAGIVLLLVSLVTAQVLRPLLELRGQVMSRRPADLRPLLDGGLPEEIRPLLAAVNALMTRMQEAYEAQHRFVADAAHELRSPLTAVQLQGEIVARATSDQQRSEALAKQREGLARATHLVEQLLALARQDSVRGGAKLQFASLDQVVRESVDDLHALAQQRRIEIAVEFGGEASALVAETLARSIIHNLLDNAIKYAPEAGQVLLQARHDHAGLWIRVEDSGPGIAAVQRERVIDRFYRIPGSAAYGSGLGLAIVDQACRAAGGRLELGDSESLGGLSATCVIPAPGPGPVGAIPDGGDA